MVLIPMLEFSSAVPFRDFNYVLTIIRIVFVAAVVAGCGAVLGVVTYAKTATSFEYDGSWKGLRKKIKFI